MEKGDNTRQQIAEISIDGIVLLPFSIELSSG